MTRTAVAMLISVVIFPLAACEAHGAEEPSCGKVFGGAGSDWGATAQETKDSGCVAGF